MKALSLFSGIGGLDLAAEAAGIQTVAFCEREPFCQDVLHEHWPDVPIYNDVTQLRGEQIGRVDVIHGGFPCQPFSVAGKRKGKEDERFLWGEFSRLIGEIEPHWVVAENVPGIMSLAADDVCKDLEARGYEVEIFCYEALSVGALHRRMRVFFVGHSERVGLSGVTRRGTGQVSADGRCDVSNTEGFGRGSRRPECEGQQGEAQLDECGIHIPNAEHDGSPAAERRGAYESAASGAQTPEQSEGVHRRAGIIADAARERLSQCRQERARPPIGERPADDVDGGGEPAGRSAQSRLGRVAYGFPLGMDLHTEPDIPRTAQGVKDRAARLKALGNAVVPAQAYPIFKAIMEIEEASTA